MFNNIHFDNQNNNKILEILTNETDFCYAYSLTSYAYRLLNYNFNIDQPPSSQNKIYAVINRKQDIEPFLVDSDKDLENLKFQVLFARFKKMLLVNKKSIKHPKFMRNKDYTEIIKYL